jgi:hypothetical protein
VGASVRRSIAGPMAVIGDGATLDELTVLGDGAHVDAGATLTGALLPDPEDGEAGGMNTDESS